MEVNIGDKLWIFYGPSALLVGHLLETSPDGQFISISPAPYDDFVKLPISQRASIPVTWLHLRACTYVCHITYDDLQKMDEAIQKPKTGFAGFQSVALPLPKPIQPEEIK